MTGYTATRPLPRRVSRFDAQEFERGERHRFLLEVPGADRSWDIPGIFLRGSRPGKTLVITAGVHGDEFEGVSAIFDLTSCLDSSQMSGDLLCVPVTNVAAFWAGTRTNPVDGKNLARAFPGSPDGSLSDRIAFIVGEEIIAKADLYLDLHSAGVKFAMPTLIGYDSDEPLSRAAAIAFGGPVLWGSPFSSPGRTVSVAKKRGVPGLYTEAFGAGRIRPEDLLYFRKGALNLLRYLQILSGAAESEAVQWDLDGPGDIDESIASSHRGFLVPSVRLLDRVKRGDQLGNILDLHGTCVETIVANRDGVVVLIHAFSVVDPNEALFLITGVRV